MRLARIAIVVAAGLLGAASEPQDARAAPRPILEERFIPAGGIEHWITIRGDDAANPVILFLHGGPGNAASPFVSAFAGWEKDFTVVQWDQRGAGRTFGRHGAGIGPTMTLERMTQDGIEVAQYLTRHLHKPRIILVGGSWGSVLGALMAQARPDLFHAYVGFSQVVNMRAGLAASYARIVELARAANDGPALDALGGIGPPPWDRLAKWPVYRRQVRTYEAKRAPAPRQPMTPEPAYASPGEVRMREEADDFSFPHFMGSTMSGPLMGIDLAAQVPALRVPLFLIVGQEDLVAPPELARAWFDGLTAPRKEFFLVPDSAHDPSVTEWALLRTVLTDQVRPLAIAPGR